MSCSNSEAPTQRSFQPGTKQALSLRDVAAKIGASHATVRRWWQHGRLVGRLSEDPQARVLVPVEVVDLYLRQFRLPTKLELFEQGLLSRDFLLELAGPDGGLSELPKDAAPGGDRVRLRAVTE